MIIRWWCNWVWGSWVTLYLTFRLVLRQASSNAKKKAKICSFIKSFQQNVNSPRSTQNEVWVLAATYLYPSRSFGFLRPQSFLQDHCLLSACVRSVPLVSTVFARRSVLLLLIMLMSLTKMNGEENQESTMALNVETWAPTPHFVLSINVKTVRF